MRGKRRTKSMKTFQKTTTPPTVRCYRTWRVSGALGAKLRRWKKRELQRKDLYLVKQNDEKM